MTELAHYEAPALVPVAPHYEPPTDPTGGRLVAWAAGMVAAHQIGTALSGTTFAPKDFRGKPDDAAAAILYGDEIGLTPTQSLQSIFVIGGKPSLYARAMVAVVMAAGHEVWTVSKTDTEVTVSGKRRGSSHVTTEKWTIARATKAGYTNNAKYKTDPAAMLYARAASDVCRQIAPDALAGIAYSVEELELAEPEATTPVARAPRKVQRAKPEVPEPDFEDPQTGAAVPPAAPEDAGVRPRADEPTEESAQAAPAPPITDAQMRKMRAQLKDYETTVIGAPMDRADVLALASEVAGRAIESSTELTKAEAGAVITYLAHQLGELPEPIEPEDS